MAAGMNHHRSAHALAKVSDLSDVEEFVYEFRGASLHGLEVY